MKRPTTFIHATCFIILLGAHSAHAREALTNFERNEAVDLAHSAPVASITATGSALEAIPASSTIVPLSGHALDLNLKFNGFSKGVFNATGGVDQFDLYGICPVGDNFLPDLGIIAEIKGKCLPNSSMGGSIDPRHDLSVCRCLAANKETTEGMVFDSVTKNDPESDPNRQTQRAMNENIARLNASLAAEQKAMQFQASTLPGTDSSNEFLIGAFTSRFNFDLSSRLTDIRRRAQEGYDQKSVTGASNNLPMAAITVPAKPEGDLLAPPADPQKQLLQCLPVRTFMTAKQMPSDLLFFQDLATLPATFRQDDWDYHKLKADFLRTLPRGVKTLADALANENSKKLYRRIEFLERNPLYRNLFSSTKANSTAKKQELWDMIRGAYGVGVRPEQRFANFNKLRKDTGVFFTSGTDVIEMTQDGANQNFENVLSEVPLRVNRISQKFEPGNIWMDAVIKKGTGFSVPLPNQENPNKTNPSVYAHYCPRLEWAKDQNSFTVLAELEKSFGSMYDPDDIEGDYNNLVRNLCNDEDRTAEDGTKKRWPQFLYDTCPTGSTNPICAPDKRSQLLVKFINDFPSGKPTQDELSHFMPFLEGREEIPAPTTNVANRATDQGLNQRYLGSPAAQARLAAANTDFRASGGETPSTRSASFSRTQARTAVASSTQTSSSSSSPSQGSGQQGSGQVFIPSGATATEISGQQSVSAEASVRAPDNSRSETARNEEMQALRDQIAGLTNELRTENSKATSERDAAEIRSLTGRIDSLNARLEQMTAESARRREIASQEDNSSERPRRRNSDRDDDESIDTPATSAQVAAQAAVAQPEAQANTSGAGAGGNALVPSTGGATLSRNSAGVRRASGTINNALLANQRGSAEGSGDGQSIVVSNASSAEYQQLRSQSGNAISEKVPGDIFQRISEGETSLITQQFADNLPTRPGEKRLFEVINQQAENSKVEVIVTKTDNGYSIAFGQNRRPAAVAPVGREATLEGLNQRILESR